MSYIAPTAKFGINEIDPKETQKRDHLQLFSFVCKRREKDDKQPAMKRLENSKDSILEKNEIVTRKDVRELIAIAVIIIIILIMAK